jgi:autophagy-related protein 33
VKVGLTDDEIGESAVLIGDGNGSGSSVKSESGEDDTEAMNGEVVRRGVERGQAVEAFRTGFWGLGFMMGIVGIWGDGA